MWKMSAAIEGPNYASCMMHNNKKWTFKRIKREKERNGNNKEVSIKEEFFLFFRIKYASLSGRDETYYYIFFFLFENNIVGHLLYSFFESKIQCQDRHIRFVPIASLQSKHAKYRKCEFQTPTENES
jgi:hypothetical protein